ncbi:MAG: hypothetical protein MK105_19090 [Crocinitomicaceae bacterium]|nr:hypothetical protein [Crocinitomicaceae bacterium]
MSKSLLPLLIFLSLSSSSFSQIDFIPLTEDFIRDSVHNSGWVSNDSTQKKDYENMYIVFEEDTISFLYFNIIEAIGVNFCAYKSSYNDLLFEITLISCDSEIELEFVYCYFTKSREMLVFFSEKRYPMTKESIDQFDWLRFSKIQL